MKVLLIHQVFMTPGEAGGTRHFELARHLVQSGHQVTVIASTVSYLTGQQVPGRRERIDGVEIRRAWAYAGVQRGFLRRVLSFIGFMFTSLVSALRVPDIDLVWGTSPPLFQGLTALLVARLRRVPFVFEVRDLWPDFAVQTGVLRNRMLIGLARQAERLLYRQADRLIVNSPGFIPHLRGSRAAAEVELVANGVETGAFAPAQRGERVRAELGLSGKFVVLYTGALGLANDLDTLLDAAARLHDVPAIRVVLLGDGKERLRLAECIRERNLVNVSLIPAQAKSRMPEFLAAADVCVATLKPIPMFATVYPNKVFDYMAAGRPTVLAIDGVIRQVIEEAAGGTFVPPGNAQAIADAVLAYYHNPELARRHGAAARRYVQARFERREQAGRLQQVLTSCVAQARARRAAGRVRRVDFVKRVLDLGLAIPGLAVLGPVLLLTALLVRRRLGAPVLFRQQRPGLRGRPFALLKFRTMSDERGPDGRLLPDVRRLTRLGQVLRALSLDELPSLFNVLKGEMSLVGPRPLLTDYLSRYTPEQARRHLVKPGITGWAQVNGRNAISWAEKLARDVWYVDNRSLGLDLRILAMTPFRVLARQGVRAPGHATAPEFTGSPDQSAC
jgi:lipopolysaccharide/colanic/teichoic acid biosynthesis glycosyltransferase